MARKAGSRGGGSTAWARRIVAIAVIGGAIWFGVQGGEFSTFDLAHQRKQTAALQREVGALQHGVDSLSEWKHAVETDPAVQERIAREEFGMLRGTKELLYRFVDTPDSARRK